MPLGGEGRKKNKYPQVCCENWQTEKHRNALPHRLWGYPCPHFSWYSDTLSVSYQL